MMCRAAFSIARVTAQLSLGLRVSVCALTGQQAGAQTTYTVKPTPKTVAWGHYDAKAELWLGHQ
jgi:hypothetical protein